MSRIRLSEREVAPQSKLEATSDRTCTGLGQTTGALGVLQLTTAKFLENSLYTTKWRFKFALRFLLDDKRLDFQGGLAYPLVHHESSDAGIMGVSFPIKKQGASDSFDSFVRNRVRSSSASGKVISLQGRLVEVDNRL